MSYSSGSSLILFSRTDFCEHIDPIIVFIFPLFVMATGLAAVGTVIIKTIIKQKEYLVLQLSALRHYRKKMVSSICLFCLPFIVQ